MIIKCLCCGRQIVSYQANDSYIIGGRGATRLLNGFCCYECSEDLDVNGNFPEEVI